MTVKMQTEKTRQAVMKRLVPLQGERVTEKISAGKEVKGFWGTAPTGKPHIGYLVPLVKIAESIAAGVQVDILIADHYAYLINHDVPLEVIEHRSQYYTFLLTSVLKALGVPPSKINIKRESATITSDKFCKAKMQMCAVSSIDEIRAVGPEVHDTATLSPLLCPIHQALSDIYMECDFQLGGFDQRGVFEYSQACLPRIGYEPNSYLMATMIPGLKSGKMSSSAPDDTKIMFSDSGEKVNAKIMGADLPGGDDPSNNGIMAMFEHIVFPFQGLNGGSISLVEVRSVDGEVKQFTDYESLERDFVTGTIDTVYLRGILARALNLIMRPVREEYAASREWRLAEQGAYDVAKGIKPV